MSLSSSHLGYCVNCHHSSDQNSTAQQQQEIICEVKVDDDDPQKVSSGKATVEEILSSIYRLQYLEELQFRDKENSATANKNHQGEKIGVCKKCYPILDQLFNLFNQFNVLRVSDSYLSQKLDTLDDLIHRLQIENIGDDATASVKSEPEEGTGGSNGPDMSQFIEVNIKEDRHPTSSRSIVKKNKRNHNYDSTVQTTNENLYPIVKVRRLCDEEIKAAATTTTTTSQRLRNKKLRANINNDEDDGQNYFTKTKAASPRESVDTTDDDLSEASLSSTPNASSSWLKKTTKKKVKTAGKRVTQKAKDSEKNDEKEFDGTCHICHVSFKMPRNLHTHLLTHIEPENSCPFRNCPKSYTTRKAVINHLRDSHFSGQHKCPVPNCPKECSRKYELQSHVCRHWRKGIFICDHCHQIFSTKAILLSHRQSTHPKSDQICPACPDQTFKTELQLNAHLNTCHPGINLYSCEDCSRGFQTKRALNHHSLIHKEDRQVYRCPRNCGRKFKTELQTMEHEEKCTYDVYRCDLCSKSFSTKYSFNMHQKMHNEELAFKCDFDGCDKAYVNSSALARHRQKHSGLRPFVCHQCGMAFVENSTLNTHFEVHATEKPHLCSVCGKRFVRIGGLKSHMTSHNESKQFPCSHCDKVFKFKAGQHLHFMTVHKEGFSCHVCGAKFPYNVTLQKHLTSVHQLDEGAGGVT